MPFSLSKRCLFVAVMVFCGVGNCLSSVFAYPTENDSFAVSPQSTNDQDPWAPVALVKPMQAPIPLLLPMPAQSQPQTKPLTESLKPTWTLQSVSTPKSHKHGHKYKHKHKSKHKNMHKYHHKSKKQYHDNAPPIVQQSHLLIPFHYQLPHGKATQ